MPRPTGSKNIAAGKTKAELKTRREVEDVLTGNDKPVPPDWLTPEQRELWDEIVNHYLDSSVLSSLDATMLTRTVVAAEWCDRIDREIAQGIREMDRTTMTVYKDYFNVLKYGCTEFGMSIAARAKSGTLMWAARKEKEKQDDLVDLLGE